MVWRISNKVSDEETKENLRKTGLYGTGIILTLGLLAWVIEHIRIV